ncbi:RHS repeat domain-containing protein [Sphingomonas sp. YR710]|uniref:RHS repeat domain-containing protein n=1 Tax=Sphingomonas sp. YR710 TaxID=1882773 RepID=UPI00159FE58B|nr:RHS repeat-associated core domain-containing protein [Sphingomonas sp. YR710]
MALGTTITKPNGEVVTLTYQTGGYSYTVCNPGDACEHIVIHIVRLWSVTNNYGYELQYGYETNSVSSSTSIDQWYNMTSVTAINNGYDTCTLSGCTLSNSWPSVISTFSTVMNSSTGLLDLLESVTDPAGGVTRYRTTPSRQLTGIKRPASSSDNITIAYDSNGRVSSYANGASSWTYGYSDSGSNRTTTRTDALGHTRVTVADMSKAVVTTDTDENGQATVYTPDSLGRIARVTEPEGNYVAYVFDTRGNVTTTTVVSKTAGSPANITTTAAFPSSCANPLTCNEPTSTTDALGKVTNYTYDSAHGGVLTVTAPPATSGGMRPQTRYSYSALYAWYENSAGTLAASVTPIYLPTATSTCQTTASCAGTVDEVKTTVTYQAGSAGAGSNLLPLSSSSGAGDGSLTVSASTTYDKVGNSVTKTDPLGNVTYLFYDADRRVVGMISPDPDGAGTMKRRATRLSYNADGQVTASDQGTANGTSLSDLTGMTVLQTLSTTYDSAAPRKLQEALIAGGVTQAVTQYSYDALGRSDCTARRMSSALFTGTLPSACTQATPVGNFGPDQISKTYYDGASQVTKVQSGYGTALVRDEITNTYTANGKTATVADAKGNVTAYAYDGFDRLWRTCFQTTAATCAGSPSDYEELTYDVGSRVTARRRRDGVSYSLGYDDLNRLTGRFYSPGNNNANALYYYDLLGRLTSTNRGNGAYGVTSAAVYDALGRKVYETSAYNGVNRSHNYSYYADGRRATMTWYNDSTASFSGSLSYVYDNLGEMTGILESGSSSLAAFYYDDLGRRTAIGRPSGAATYYGYDAMSRLNALSHDLAGTAQDYGVNYSYTPASQISQRISYTDLYAWTQNYNVNRSYTVNGLNQYAQITSAGSISPTYDARGNLTNAGSKTYSYSTDNELTGADSDRFDFDAFDRLLYSASSHTRFDYDGADLVAEYDDSGNLLRRYVHGSDTDEPLVWYEGSGSSDKRWLHADERGSIVAVSDSVGSAIAINSYDPWGIPAMTNLGRFQYTGQAWLPELGMYYYKARIYSPTMGRFLQTDPVGYADGLNWYAYVGNDPMNGSDPSGLAQKNDTSINIAVDCKANPGDPHCNSNNTIIVTARHNHSKSPDVDTINVQMDVRNFQQAAMPQNLSDPLRADPIDFGCVGSALWSKEGAALGLDALGVAVGILAPEAYVTQLALSGASLIASGITSSLSDPVGSIRSLSLSTAAFLQSSGSAQAKLSEASSAVARQWGKIGLAGALVGSYYDAKSVMANYDNCRKK